MQNVGIAVLVLQVTKLVWMVMFLWLTSDMYIVSSSTLYQLWYNYPQSNLESPYGDMALLSVIGYLLSRCFVCCTQFVYLFSFWTKFLTFFQHGPYKPLCVHDFQDVRTCEEELFESPSWREQHQQWRKWSWQHSLHQWESWKKQLVRRKRAIQKGIFRGVWQQGFLNTWIATIKSRLPTYKVQNF